MAKQENNFFEISEQPECNTDMPCKTDDEDNLNECSFSTCKSADSNKKASPSCNEPYNEDSFSSDNDMDDQ